MDTITSADGTDVLVHTDGHGPAVLLIGPGLDDGSRTKKLATILATRFRVLRLHRRQYRLDLKTAGTSCSIGHEVADVLAVAAAIGEPLLIYGHSSGGVVALEALTASPSSFAGGVIFEPAAVTGRPLAGENGEVITRARAAIAAGHPGAALTIFIRDTVGLPPAQARLAGMVTAVIPHYRKLVPAQIDDLEAIDRLGVRLDAYARIAAPVLLLGGDRSPAHLADRLDAIEQAMPNTERIVLHNRDHGADLKAPKQLASIIEKFADKVFG